MKGFYDNMLPKEIGKYVKQWGGKVERGETITPQEDGSFVGLVRGVPVTSYRSESEAVADLNRGEVDSLKSTPIWRIDITPEMARSVSTQGQPLFQNEQGGPKGPKASFERIAESGKTLLRGLQDPDFTSAAHEFAHVSRNNMEDILTPEEVKTATEWAGAEKGWDRKEERWARAWERYFREGKAPIRKLQPIFDKIAKWMTEVYATITGSDIDVEISEEVLAIFDRLASRLEHTLPPEMLGEDQNTDSKPSETPPTDETPAVMEPEERTTGVRKEDINESRLRHGMSPLSPNKMGTNQSAMDEAQQILAADPDAANKLLARVQTESLRKDAEGKRMEITPLNTLEIALVAIERTKRQIAEAEAHKKWERAREAGDPTAAEAAWNAVMDAEQRVDDVGIAINLPGSAWGSAGRALQMHLRDDFTLGGLRRKFRAHANKGEALTPEQTAKLAEYAERLRQLEARAQAYAEAEAAWKDGNEEMAAQIVEQQRLIEKLTEEIEVERRNGLSKTDNAARRRRLIKAKLEPLAEEARKRLRELGFTGGPDVLFQEGNVSPETVARHAELEAKFNAGTITPEETAEAVRIVEEAAKKAGLKLLHHGSVTDLDDQRFTVPITPLFLGSKGVADRYAEFRAREAGPDFKAARYDLFTNFKKTASDSDVRRVAKKLLIEADDYTMAMDLLDPAIGGRERVDRVVAELKIQGYDSARISDFDRDEEFSEIESYVAFDPSQAKSADPFTGVPLDQRFNPESPSILYQESETSRDLAYVLASKMADEELDIADATIEMMREFGKGVADYVEEAHGLAKQMVADTRAGVEGEGHQSAEAILASLGPEIDLTKRDVWDLARAHLIDGKRGSDVLNAVTDDLQKIYPDLTRDEVATLFTDYGKVSYPDPGEIPQALNRLRLLERAALKLIDLAKGLMPKRTGFQRGVMDDSTPEAKKELAEIRQREKQVRKEMREIEDQMRKDGIEIESDERRLKTQLEATKRRMKNEIEEIKRALTPPVTPRVRVTRGGVTFDEDATELRSELEQLRKEYNEAFKSETTEEQRAAIIEKSLDRRIAEEEQMLKDGILTRPKNEPVTSPANEAKRLRLAELRQRRRDLYEAAHPGETALEQAKAATLRSIAHMEEMLRTGDVAAKRREQVAPDAHLEALLATRDALADEVAERRKALRNTPEQERAEVERALRQSEATLAKLEAKLAAGDLSIETSLPTLAASNLEVQKVRNRIKELNRELARQRREAKPKRDPMVVRLDRYIRDMAKRRAVLQNRVARGDTSPLRKKTEPLRQKEAREARYAYEDAKKEFNQMVFQKMLANMSTRERIVRNTKDALFQLGRMVMTSFDAGAIGRQAFLVALNNPKVVLKNLSKGFAFNEKFAARVENEIENHRLYHVFTEAGLSITSWRPGYKLEQQEEEHRSRLARKIPGVKQSEMAYVTYLNSVRMSYAERLYKSLDGTGQMDTEGLKELMNHINNMTGRGSLGNFEGSAGAISDYFFSVKYWSSRVRFLVNLTWRPLDYVTGGAISKATMKSERLAAQKIISREYAKSAAGYAIFYSLLALGRTFLTDEDDEPLYDIGSDPTSSDFGKLVFGNGTRVDVGGGVLQNAVFGARARERSVGDKRGASGFNSLESLATRFIRTKVSPSVGVAWNLATGEDFLGEPVYAEKELVGTYIPITFTEMYEGFSELGIARGTAAGIASFLGFGTSTYGPGTKDVDAIEDLVIGVGKPVADGILLLFDREVRPNRYLLPAEVGLTRKK